MGSLTVTALVLLSWTFKPFADLNKANAFIDSLPATANAQLFWAKAETLEEQLENQRKSEEEFQKEKLMQSERDEKKKTCKETIARLKAENPGIYFSELQCDSVSIINNIVGIVDIPKDRWIVRYKIPREEKSSTH